MVEVPVGVEELVPGVEEFVGFTSGSCTSLLQLSLVSKPIRIACSAFSDSYTHSRLDSWLFCLLPSIWFTCGLLLGLGIKVYAISLWIKRFLRFPSSSTNVTIK